MTSTTSATASLLSSMPPRALCSASRSCGGVRSGERVSPWSRPSARPIWAIDTFTPLLLACAQARRDLGEAVSRAHRTGESFGSIVGATSDFAALVRPSAVHVGQHYEPHPVGTTQPVDKSGDNLRETPWSVCRRCVEPCGQQMSLYVI